MRLNFFGREVTITIDDKKINKKGVVSSFVLNNKFRYRFLLLSSMFLIFGIFMETKRINISYHIGDKATKDVIAYKDVVYYKDLLDESVKNRIIENTTPEYDRNKEVEDNSVSQLNTFFDSINWFKLQPEIDNAELKSFIDQNKLNLSVDELRTIILRDSSSYILALVNDMRKIYAEGIVKKGDFDKIVASKDYKLGAEEKKLLKNFMVINMKFNQEKTKEKIDKNIESLKNQEMKIYKGDVILKKGDVITADAYEKLEKLNMVKVSDKARKSTGLLLSFVILSMVLYYILKKYSKKIMDSKAFYPSLITVAILNLIYLAFFQAGFLLYLLPFAIIPIILSILGDRVFAITLSVFNLVLLTRDETWFLITLGVTVVAIYQASALVNRSEFVKLGVFLGVFQALLSVAYGLVNQFPMTILGLLIILSVFSGILTGMICLALLPFFENTFDILTNIKLLELSDFSHPLLRSLLVKASGTFHHSIMVGALAERAAESVGANATFARVASYYHDIGKMKRPNFFVENQKGRENPHNHIKPTLSALIIISHTKDGVAMGKKYNLPKEILDIMVEHHGTTLVQYFYNKAMEEGEEIREQDFRYAGPKPRSKESAIILLADTIEAAVRASEDKSKESVESLVRYLIKYKIEDGQLALADITLREIEIVIRSFLDVLQGAYHQRIQYPKVGEDKKLLEEEDFKHE